MLFKSFQRAVRIFLCIYFITYDISIGYAQDSPILGPLAVSSLGGIPLQNQPVETKALLESIKIPSDVGEIIDQNIISERPLLFILEDIHCNTEVEGNEEKILRALEAEIKDAGKLGSWEAKKQKVSPSFLASQLPSQPFYVFSEAASGPIDMSFFTAFPDQKALAEAQKKFLMNHDINSLESFLISEGDKVKGWGVEDVRTYVDNARAMGALMEERELQEPVWADLDETIKNLRLKIYPKELWELMEKREKYREYKIGVGEYVNQISKIKDQNDRSKIRNDQFVIASEAKQSQLYLYPSIEKFLELQTLEKKTDASKIESEYLKFLSKLEKKLPKEELNEVLKNVLEYRLGRVSDEEHYLFLSKYLEPEDGESFSPLKLRGEGGVMEENNNPSDSPYGFRLSASTTSSFTHKWVPELGRLKGREKQEEKELYPNLKLFIQQMSLMKQISWEKLDEEIEKREEDMIEELAITDQAKQLIELEKNYDVLKRVVSMEGNREDLKVVWSSPLHTIPPLKVRGAWGVTPLKGPGELGVRGVMKEEEVTPSIPLKKIRGRKNLQGEEEYIEKFSQALKKLCEKNNLSFESPDFGDIFKIAEKFYEKVLERDPIMYEKTVKLLEQRKLKYAAIIMGGFHTEGFRERLKAANIGYCVISPRMNKMDDRSGYFRKIKEFDDLLENPINTSFSDIMKNLAKEMLKDAHLTDSDFEKWKNRATHFSNIIQDLTLQYSQTGQWIRDPTQMNFINQLRKLLARGGTAARLTQSYLKKALGEDDQDFVTFLESDASSNPKNQKQSHSAFANQFMPPTVTNMLPQALALEVGQEPGDQLGTTLDITHMRGPVLHQAGTITVTGEGLPAEVVECVLSLKKRLANATRELWEAVPTLDRMELNLVTREFNQRYPELFKEATEYFGTEWQVADFLVLLAKPIQNAESYTNPEVLEELLERLKTKNGRWIIAIDGANGSGKTTFWSSIRSKNNVLGELSEEMAFVEGEKQLWDLHQQVTHDTELPFDVAYGIEHDPTVVQSWVDKMLKKHGRFMRDLGFLGGPDRQRETINLILRYPKDIDGFRKAFLESVEDRIIVYNANGSHDYVDKQLASDTEFPTTRVAKVKVIANSDRTRRLEISYKIVGQALDDLERRLVEQDGATTGASVPSSDDPLGRCVTADTMLPIVRKLGAKSFGLGEKEETPIVIPQLIPIVQVRPDDYVFSLNEETGKLEPHRIRGLMDMGVKPVFRLTTASGRSIRTTANHPYLKKVEGNEKQVEGGSSKVEGKDKNTFIPSTLDLRASASLFPSTFSLPALTYSHWTPVSQLHVGDKIAVPSRKFFLRAQGIERGKMTGDGCVQQPRSDVGTNEDGIELSQLKGSCEDNRIGSGEVMSHNKIVRRKDLSFSDVPDSNSLVRNVFGESSQSHSEIGLTDVTSKFNTGQGGYKLSQGQTGDHDAGVFFFENLNNGGTSYFGMVSLNKGAGIKKIEHDLYLVFAKTNNLFSQINFYFSKTLVNCAQQWNFPRKPFLWNELTSWINGESSVPKALNCDFLRGLCDRIGFHNWIQYTTLFHLVSMSFFHWTQVSQLHIGDAIAVPTGSFGDFSAFVRSVADLNTLHKEGIAFEIERSAMFSYTKAMCAGWQINQWLSTNQGIIKLGIIFQFLRNALLNIFRQSAKLAIGSRGELNLEHKGIYTSPNFFLTFSKGMYPFFSASEMDLRKEVSKPGSSGNFDSISSISHPEGLTRLSWYSSVENRSTSASSMSESTSSNANVSKIKNLGALFLSTMTAAFECFPNLKRVEAIAFRKGKSFSAPRFDKAFMLHPPGINRIQNEIHLSSKYSAKSHIFWDRIQSIELTGFERVYDIEVEGTHNFIGNGIVAHNTYMTSPDPSSPKVSIGDPEVGVLNPLVPEGVGGQSKAEPAMTVTSTSEPEAEVERGNVISRELTPIQGMLLKKERSLKRDGHHAWLSRLLVEKQIQLAEQSILIVQNALNDELYLFEFVKAMANLERVATFFEVSRDGLQEILGHPLSSQEIYFRYRAFIEFARTQPEDVRKELEKKDGKFPKEEIDPGNFQAHLAEQIKFFNGERPNLRQSLNKILSENPDKKKLKEEALQWLDYFLYSTEFSFDFYLELSDLMKLAGFKSFEGLLRSRKSKSSPAELNIMEKIRENQEGRMTYHEFMRMALYDPEHGFYTKPRTTPIPSAKAGEGGEFRTLPEEFGQFGRGLAYDLMDQWKAMGKPTRFQIIEMGAGQGTMAEQILSTIKTLSDKGIEDWPGFFKAIQYTIVEISPSLKAQQMEKLASYGSKVEWKEGSALDVPKLFPEGSVVGAFISNELPDAFPVHKVKFQNGKLWEVYVREERGAFVETLGPLSTEALGQVVVESGVSMEEGETRVINLDADQWLEGLGKVLARGSIMTLDYGYSAEMGRMMRLLRPQFRKYGREQSKMELKHLGIKEESSALDEFMLFASLASESVGKEGLQEALAQIVTESGNIGSFAGGEWQKMLAQKLGINPFEEMEMILDDFLSHPLSKPGALDITTDVDFDSLSLRARRLGIKQTRFSTQGDYFRQMLQGRREEGFLRERSSHKDGDFDHEEMRMGMHGNMKGMRRPHEEMEQRSKKESLYDVPSAYKIQVFKKENEVAEQVQSLQKPLAYHALLTRGTITSPEDVRVLIHFLQNHDALGLKQMAQALEEAAQKLGRPLVGISSDCLIHLAPTGAELGSTRLPSQVRGFDGTIEMSRGISIENFIHILARFAPKETLPQRYQSMLESLPTLDSQNSLGQIYENSYQRLVGEEVIAEFVGLDFALTLQKEGYQVYSPVIPLQAKETLFEQGPEQMMARLVRAEPFRTKNQFQALWVALHVVTGEETKALKWGDIFSIQAGSQHKLDLYRLKNQFGALWSKAGGGNLLDLFLQLKKHFSPRSKGASGFKKLMNRTLTQEGVMAIKEELIRTLILVLGAKIDERRAVLQAGEKEAVDLGPRISVPAQGDQARIQTEPENSRNLTAIFSRYQEYVEHERKARRNKEPYSDDLNLARLLHPEGDRALLMDFAQGAEGEYGTISSDLIKAIYEAGFHEKVKTYVQKMLDDPGYYKEEIRALIPFFASQKNQELLSLCLQGVGEQFGLSEGYVLKDIFENGYEPVSPLLASRVPYEARNFYGQEWEYVKNVVRIYIAGGMRAANDTAKQWIEKEERPDLSNLSFDMFNSRISRDPERAMARTLTGFIEQGLKSPELFEMALGFLDELPLSPMKLELYRRASHHLPHSWDEDSLKSFYEKWNYILHAIGQQLEENSYFEPWGEFQKWSRPFDQAQEIGKGFFPPSYRASRLFHEHILEMLEGLRGRVDRYQHREFALTMGDELAKSVEGETAPFFNHRGMNVAGQWIEEPFFFSELSRQKILGEWSLVSLSQAIQAQNMDQFLDTEFPLPVTYQRDQYFNDSRDERKRASYLQSLQVFLDSAQEIHAVALAHGQLQEARALAEGVRERLLKLERDESTSSRPDATFIQEIQQRQTEWLLEMEIQGIISFVGDPRDLFSAFKEKLLGDSRGFYRPELIANGASKLSRRTGASSDAIELFKIAIEKLADQRGEKNWLSREMRDLIQEASLTIEEKDAVYLFLLEKLWPKQKHSITDYFGLRGDLPERINLVREFLEEKKYPRTLTYLIERFREGVNRLNAHQAGREISLRFEGELKALSLFAGYFTDRRELLNPVNFKALVALYPTPQEGWEALKVLFPEEVSKERQKGKMTTLPFPEEVRQGNFNAQALGQELIPLLNETQPEGVWQEAVSVLEEWFRQDVLKAYHQKREVAEKDKSFGEKKYFYVEEKNLSSSRVYQLISTFIQPLVLKENRTDFENRLLEAVLGVKSEEEASGKSFLYYGLLQRKDVVLSTKSTAFQALAKTDLIPTYATNIFNRFQKKNDMGGLGELFNFTALWDQTFLPTQRSRRLWAHYFEEGDASVRECLKQRLQRYLVAPLTWKPDLTQREDVWILLDLCRMEDGEKVSINDLVTVLIYQHRLKQESLIERVMTLLKFYSSEENFFAQYLLLNWSRCENVSWEEAQSEYGKKAESYMQSTFEEMKKNFLALKKGSLDEVSFFAHYPDRVERLATLGELLGLLGDETSHALPTDLKSILSARFPKLSESQVEALIHLSENPFRISENNKGWKRVSGKGYPYSMEKQWQGEIVRVAGGVLGSREIKNLISFLYPYSKTFILNGFDLSGAKVYYQIPSKALSGSWSCESTHMRFLLDVFSGMKSEEVMAFENHLPAYARIGLARDHQMAISGIELPKALEQDHPLAQFLLKTYFHILPLGAKEGLARLQNRSRQETLNSFFHSRDLIKIAQLLANRPEVPIDYRELLKGVFDQVKESDESEVRAKIEAELGWKSAEYQLLKCLNAGSMGEVWLVQREGSRLAVKILTQTKKKNIDRMLEEIEKMIEVLENYQDLIDEAPLCVEILDRLRKMVKSEMDFRNDEVNWKKLFGLSGWPSDQDKLEPDGTVSVPNSDLWTVMIYQSTRYALVMSYVDGVNVDDRDKGVQDPAKRTQIARKLWTYFRARFSWVHEAQLYPMDLHIGNVVFLKESEKTVLLDFGQVGLLPQREYLQAFELKVSWLYEAEKTLIELEKMGGPREGKSYDREGLLDFLRALKSDSTKSDFEKLRDIYIQAYTHGLFIRRSYLDFLKGMTTLEGTLKTLDPHFRMSEEYDEGSESESGAQGGVLTVTEHGGGGSDPLGRCVTSDTMLPIMRKLGARGWKLGEKEEMPIFIHQVVPIVQVRPDDYVFSLNEETGKIELHRIMGLMDMGVKPVFKLTTASGRSIRTTANHPYLKRIMDHGQEKDDGSWVMDHEKNKTTSHPPSIIQDPSSVSQWTPVSRLHIGDKIAVPSRKFVLHAQGIERGKMTGDGCVQQPGSDIGTNEDGIELSQLKGSCEDNRICSSEIMSHDKIVRRKDLSFSDIPDSNSLVRNVFGESSQGHSEVGLIDVTSKFDTSQCGYKLGQGQTGDHDAGVFFFENLNNGGTSYFGVVALNKGAGIKKIEHDLYLVFAKTNNLFSQINFYFSKTLVNCAQQWNFPRKPFLWNELTSWINGESSVPKALNGDFLHGLRDRIGFHNWIQYTTLFHLVSMSFFQWTLVGQLHVGDAIAVPRLSGFPQLTNGLFNDFVGNEKITFLVQCIDCLFSSVQREPSALSTIRDKTDCAMDFDMKFLSNSSGREIVGKKGARPEVVCEMQTIQFSAVKWKTLEQLFDGLGRRVGYRLDDEIRPLKNFIQFIVSIPKQYLPEQPLTVGLPFSRTLSRLEQWLFAWESSSLSTWTGPILDRASPFPAQGLLQGFLLAPHGVVWTAVLTVWLVYRSRASTFLENCNRLNARRSNSYRHPLAVYPQLLAPGFSTHWTPVSQLHTGDKIAVPKDNLSSSISIFSGVNAIDDQFSGFDVKEDAVFTDSKTMSGWRKVDKRFCMLHGMTGLNKESQLFCDALLNLMRKSIELSFPMASEIKRLHRSLNYLSPNFRLISLKGIVPCFLASSIPALSFFTSFGLMGRWASIASISQPRVFLFIYSLAGAFSSKCSSDAHKKSHNEYVSKIKYLGEFFLSSMTAALKSLEEVKPGILNFFDTDANLVTLSSLTGVWQEIFIMEVLFIVMILFNQLYVPNASIRLSASASLSNKSSILWDRIQSIEWTGFERVYDIEVEGTHNFIGNGIVAHNTYITSLSPIHAVGQSASPPSIEESEKLRDEGEKGQVAVEYMLLLPLLIPLLVLGLPLYVGIRLFWSRCVRVPARSLSPSNLRAYQNLLIEIDPENQSHYEICAQMTHAFEALLGGALAAVERTGHQFFLGQSGRVIINKDKIVGLSVLAHEYAHAHFREPLPAFVTGGSFAELFESIYRRMIADEVQAFEAQILFAKKFKEKRSQSLWDLPSESGVKSMMVELEAIYDEQGRQGIQEWLERGYYLTYKIQALKMAALFRAGALDENITGPEPLGQGGKKIERDLIKELWNALKPQLTQNPLGVLNLSRQPEMKRAIRKFWDVSTKNGVLESEDIDFLRNDFDKMVTFVGVLFGEPVPGIESLSGEASSGPQQVIHPLFDQPSQPWDESSQEALDVTQAENHLARWQFLAQYKILASVSDSVGVMEALLLLVSSQDQKRILSDLYERVETEPLKLYHVAQICASYGYLEASHKLLERAFQHPENFPLRVDSRSLPHLLQLLEIFDQREDDEGRDTVIAILTQYVERRGLDDWIYDFGGRVLKRPFKENEVDELRAHGQEVIAHSWIAMNPERIHEILGWEPKKGHYPNLLISYNSFQCLQSLDSALEALESKYSLSQASSQAIVDLRFNLRNHLSRMAMASESNRNKLNQLSFVSPDFYQGLPPLEDLKFDEDRFSNYVYGESLRVSLSSSHPDLENLKHFSSFDDVLKFLSHLDPLSFHALLFAWVGENLDQWPQSDAAGLIQVWDRWAERADQLSGRFHHQGYTKFSDQQMSLQGLSSAYQSLPRASSFLESPDGMRLYMSLAEGWLKSSNLLLKAKAEAILKEVQSKSAVAFWSPRSDYDMYTYFFSQHTGFWIAKAWLLDGIQGSGGLNALKRAYDILSNPPQRLHTSAQVSEWIELLLDLALAFERAEDSSQRAACEQAAYNYVQEMDRQMRSEDFRARDSRYNNKPKKSDALLRHLQMTYQRSQAVYRTRLAIQQDSRQVFTTGLAPQGEFKDYNYRQFLAMARELAQAHWNRELIQVLERMIVQVRARSGFEIEGEQNIVSSIQTFFEEENSFVQIVLNASLSPLEKDDWILRYAQAVIGEEERILSKGDLSSLARVARGFEPLLKAVRDGKCPRSEAFLLKNLAETLDDLKATYPNLVENGVRALAPLVSGLEESHPELLQSGKREAYQALLPENQALRQALDVLFPLEDRSEIARLSQNLYEEAMEALNLKMQLEGWGDALERSYTRLSLDELTGLRSFGVLRGGMTASSDGPLDPFLENPERVREVLMGEPMDSMRAQVFSPLLREIFLKSRNPEVRAMAVQGLIVAGYLGSYAEHLCKKSEQSRQNLYRILEAVAGAFASPIPDELFALYDESSPAISESYLKNPKFIEYIYHYNKSREPLLIHVDSLAPTIQDPQAELFILTVFSHSVEDWLEDYTQGIVEASKTLKTRLRVKMFLETTTLPKPLKDLPETLKFVFAVFLFQNPNILSRFNAYCRENSKLSQGDLLCAFFRMAHAEKLAQALANWPGLLPPPLQEALAQTQQDNEPISQLEFLMDLNEALGGDYRDPFSEIDWSSRRVGSVAEVVRAKRKDTDKWVAIKLIPSRRMKGMERHLEGMEKLFEVLSLYKDEKFRGVDPALFGKEYIRSYRQELDLRNEAKNVSVMQPLFQRIGQVRMPEYQGKYMRPRLLVMSWEEGTPLKDLAPDEKKKAVEALSRLVIEGIFQEGRILDDLHSDNVRWNKNKQKLIVWDFGRLSTITEFDRDILLDYLSAIYQRDANGIIQALQKMADPRVRGYDEETLLIRVEQNLRVQALLQSQRPLSMAQLAYQLVSVVGKSNEASTGLVVDARFTLLVKALLTLENVGSLDPTFDLSSKLAPWVLEHSRAKAVVIEKAPSRNGHDVSVPPSFLLSFEEWFQAPEVGAQSFESYIQNPALPVTDLLNHLVEYLDRYGEETGLTVEGLGALTEEVGTWVGEKRPAEVQDVALEIRMMRRARAILGMVEALRKVEEEAKGSQEKLDSRLKLAEMTNVFNFEKGIWGPENADEEDRFELGNPIVKIAKELGIKSLMAGGKEVQVGLTLDAIARRVVGHLTCQLFVERIWDFIAVRVTQFKKPIYLAFDIATLRDEGQRPHLLQRAQRLRKEGVKVRFFDLGENKDLRALVPTEELIVLSGEGDVGEPLTKAIDQKPEQIRVIGDEKNWPRYGPSLREKGIQAVYAREGFDVDWLVWAVLCADSAEEFNRLIKALEIPKEEADALREQMTQDGGVRPPLQVRSLMRDMELTRESADIRDESM